MLFKIAPGDFISPIYALSRTHLRGLETASKVVMDQMPFLNSALLVSGNGP
jgi:hypothetical protein